MVFQMTVAGPSAAAEDGTHSLTRHTIAIVVPAPEHGCERPFANRREYYDIFQVV